MHAAAVTLERTPPRPWKRGLAWLAFLAPFFFASYAFANWLASLRPQVGAIVFDWERAIPFLAWTIVPYWSIDLLYALSLLLFTTRRELDTHASRLLAAQLIATACFVAVPLQFSHVRPAVDGAAGLLFAALESFDRPYNQAPSLHLALTVILWSAYAKRLSGFWRVALHALFVLIGISALTTWQHHFVDIPTGIWLGWFCVWLFPDEMRAPFAGARRTRDPMRRRLAFRYGMAAVGLIGLPIGLGGAWLWLCWGGASLGLVAAIYALGDESAFQKRTDGSMSAAALWLLWPYFFAARLNARCWTRSSAPIDRIAPDVYVGRSLSARERARSSIAAVVDVCAELPRREDAAVYACVPMLDLVRPTSEQIERACREIEKARAAGPLLVCCALGFSRSALVAAAWLMRSQAVGTIDSAVARIRGARPRAVLNAEHLAALHEWRERYARDAAERGRG